MFKFLIVAIALLVLYKFFVNNRGEQKNDEKKQRAKKIAKGEMVKDPICGCYVETENAISVRDGSTIHRFCSYDCRQKFLEKLESSGREIPSLSNDDD